MDKVFVVICTTAQGPEDEHPNARCVGVFTSKKNARQAMAASATREARLQNAGSVISEVRLADDSADVIIHINKTSEVLYHYQLSQHIIR